MQDHQPIITFDCLKSDLEQATYLLVSSKLFVEDLEYIHNSKKQHPVAFNTYAWFFLRTYHAIVHILIIDLYKLFGDKEAYSLIKFGRRLQESTDAELKKRICKTRLHELNQVLVEKDITYELKKVERTRNKYYAHLDRKRPSFDEIRISSEQIRSFLRVAEYYIQAIRHWFGMPDASFENTKSELGHRFFERLSEWEQYREKYGLLPR